jgi:hypothetical protein
MADSFLSLSPEEVEAKLRQNHHLEESVYAAVLTQLRGILEAEPNVLVLKSPLVVVGGIRGDLFDLLSMFNSIGRVPERTFLFLGDYVCRGLYSLQTFLYLSYLKIRHPHHVYLLRGLYEERRINGQYGLHFDCERVYGNDALWNDMNDIFDCLPVASVIDNRIFAVPCGLSPSIRSVWQINTLNRFEEADSDAPISHLRRAAPIDQSGFGRGRHGAGVVFGPNETKSFLRNSQLGLPDAKRGDLDHGFIVRSHELLEEGFRWMHEDSMLSIWSSPNYGGRAGNKALVMEVGEGGNVQFSYIIPDPQAHVAPEATGLNYFV